MSTTSDAHVLVTIPNATLASSSSGTFAGPLALEYITFDIPSSTSATATRDVLLVLRIGTGAGAFEAPLDPARALTVSTLPPGSTTMTTIHRHRYVFHATRDDSEFTLEFPATRETADDVELFHSVLVGYAADVHGGTEGPAAAGARVVDGGDEDLRGRFVLVNEDSGEIVGALDRSVRVHEDPSLGEKGHEGDPVVVELPESEGGGGALDELRDIEVIVRAIPPEERDWMLKGAEFVSYAISGTTTLLTSAMSAASNMYIAHSTPASSSSSTTGTPTAAASSSSSSSNTAQPSRTLLLLQSPTTRKHLTTIHTVSGGAVKLSNKAVATVDRLIQRVVADRTNDNGRGNNGPAAAAAAAALAIPATGKPPLPPRSPSPSSAAYLRPSDNNNKPALPPRTGKSRSRTPSPSPSPLSQPQSQSQSPKPLGTGSRVALSAAIILASLEASTVRLAESGSAAVTAAVAHKYGATAGENAALATGAMCNVVLVYVDVHGLGRKAVVKRVAKSWAKGRVASARAARAGESSPKK